MSEVFLEDDGDDVFIKRPLKRRSSVGCDDPAVPLAPLAAHHDLDDDMTVNISALGRVVAGKPAVRLAPVAELSPRPSPDCTVDSGPTGRQLKVAGFTLPPLPPPKDTPSPAKGPAAKGSPRPACPAADPAARPSPTPACTPLPRAAPEEQDGPDLSEEEEEVVINVSALRAAMAGRIPLVPPPLSRPRPPGAGPLGEVAQAPQQRPASLQPPPLPGASSAGLLAPPPLAPPPPPPLAAPGLVPAGMQPPPLTMAPPPPLTMAPPLPTSALAPPGAPPPPPPPPPQQQPKAKQSKLKPFAWTKLPKNKIRGTVWDAVRSDPPVEVDASLLTELFSVQPAAGPVKPVAGVGRAAAPAAGGGALVLLDAKRANNIAIILSRVRLPFDEMRAAVLSLDKEALPSDAVAALLSCVPSPEELDIVVSAGVPPASLGFAERFVLEVGSIPRLQKRLECLAYMVRFDASLAAVAADVATTRAACATLRTSLALRQLLGVVLRLGNALNGGSFRGAAEGFRTDALPRLAELRTNSTPASTLLHVALSHCAALPPLDGEAEEGWERVKALAASTAVLRDVARLSMIEMADEASRFCGCLQTVKDELATASRSTRAAAAAAPTGDRFIEVMSPFVAEVEPRVDELKADLKLMQAELDATHAFFAEEPKTSMEAFFSRWATFAVQLEAAVASGDDPRAKRARVA